VQIDSGVIMSLFEDDEGGLILGDEDGDALLGEEEEQEEQAEEEEEEEEEDQALAVEDGAGDGGVSPRKAGLEPSSEVVAGDPHVEGFAECSKELVNAYMELENSVVAIIRSQDDHDLGKFEQDCYANLEKLNARCDRLRRLTVRLNILLLSFVLNVHVLFY